MLPKNRLELSDSSRAWVETTSNNLLKNLPTRHTIELASSERESLKKQVMPGVDAYNKKPKSG